MKVMMIFLTFQQVLMKNYGGFGTGRQNDDMEYLFSEIKKCCFDDGARW